MYAPSLQQAINNKESIRLMYVYRPKKNDKCNAPITDLNILEIKCKNINFF